MRATPPTTDGAAGAGVAALEGAAGGTLPGDPAARKPPPRVPNGAGEGGVGRRGKLDALGA